MKKIHKFNMVEIALAIAIIAIGISAILVLFPIGINATRAAMDENSSTDVAEYIANFVRGKYLTRWKQQFDTWNSGDKTGTLNFDSFEPPSSSQIWQTGKPGDPGDSETLGEVPGYTNKKTTPHSGLQKYNTTAGCYYFNRVSPEGEETFTALVKIWSVKEDITTAADSTNAKCPIYVPDAANAFAPKLVGDGGIQLQSSKGAVNFGSFAQSAMVEISWPANLPEDERTKRVFRVDVYNPYYMIQPETPAAP